MLVSQLRSPLTEDPVRVIPVRVPCEFVWNYPTRALGEELERTRKHISHRLGHRPPLSSFAEAEFRVDEERSAGDVRFVVVSPSGARLYWFGERFSAEAEAVSLQSVVSGNEPGARA